MKKLTLLVVLLTLTGCGTRLNLLRAGSFLRPIVDTAKPLFCPAAKAIANVHIAQNGICKSASPAAQAICVAAQLKADEIITRNCAPTGGATRRRSEVAVAASDPSAELREIYESVGMSAAEAKRLVAKLPRESGE